MSNCAQQLIMVPVPVPCLDHVFLSTGPARASIKYFHIKQNRNLRLLPIDVNGTDEPPVVMTTDRKVSELTWCAKKCCLLSDVEINTPARAWWGGTVRCKWDAFKILRCQKVPTFLCRKADGFYSLAHSCTFFLLLRFLLCLKWADKQRKDGKHT